MADKGRPPLTEGEDGWLERVEVITPAMCGHNSLFIGQLGDWTWDAVGAACRINPYIAADPAGNPVYLSFAYFRVHAANGLCAEELTFGDRLGVRSKVLSSGGDSVLTLHQVGRDGSGTVEGSAPSVADFFRYSTRGCIQVENYNRWIQRSGHGTNHGLRRATPVGFEVDHLDRIADELTPRRIWTQARNVTSFRSPGEPEPDASLSMSYRVDASRDLNGAGLLYFASYFSITDWAVLGIWRHLGRTARGFLNRRVFDRQLCFIANADADDVLDLSVTLHRDADGLDVVDVTMRHGDGGLLAVARQRIHDEANGA